MPLDVWCSTPVHRRVLEALPNVGHEAVTTVQSDPFALSIIADTVGAFDLGCCIFMLLYGLLDCCDPNLMPLKDIQELADLLWM